VDDLARYINATNILVVYRKCSASTQDIELIRASGPSHCCSDREHERWTRVGAEWPLEVAPVYLGIDAPNPPSKSLAAWICRALALPGPQLVEQVPTSGTEHLQINGRGTSDANAVLEASILNKARRPLPSSLAQFVPDREPVCAPGGFRVPVSKPHVFPISKVYVNQVGLLVMAVF
jgi:hypothetical protein